MDSNKIHPLNIIKNIRQRRFVREINADEGLSAKNRIYYIIDKGSFIETNKKLKFSNPIEFPEYEEKYNKAVNKTNMNEAVITGIASIEGIKCVLAVMDKRFFMASMGRVVGEKITAAVELADRKKLPLIIYCASGGARMQEGIFSLMQMAKTSAAIEKFSSNGGLYIAVLTNPTTGGVTASFASLADITLAEPKALIGFAGPRVIEQTIGKKLPEGFQTAEYLKEHGFIDEIVPIKEQREVLAKLLRLHMPKTVPVEKVKHIVNATGNSAKKLLRLNKKTYIQLKVK
ncbi:MAG: acetyl-CoA carboxylase carboxyltransferase subunit beta [Lachnospiraceae bacterium]|jgi:acetyl-CoA carboxylase carboxyl transferase subunit beta|nr:acetyl-CoA carboxylase carboxyltransferase subunit beta [Lachnospiraceae bacterium]MDY4427703.1 acetyl-CoA carboxylase carboxyltransferase subunit beta [Lachnospiraceae bacterium]MDY5216612.1 acetyl-CoA carboxylase carboxyltransferase subunit beta [Lachnospiraceae bacterium]